MILSLLREYFPNIHLLQKTKTSNHALKQTRQRHVIWQEIWRSKHISCTYFICITENWIHILIFGTKICIEWWWCASICVTSIPISRTACTCLVFTTSRTQCRENDPRQRWGNFLLYHGGTWRSVLYLPPNLLHWESQMKSHHNLQQNQSLYINTKETINAIHNEMGITNKIWIWHYLVLLWV